MAAKKAAPRKRQALPEIASTEADAAPPAKAAAPQRRSLPEPAAPAPVAPAADPDEDAYYIRIPKKVASLKDAQEWAYYHCRRLGVPIDIMSVKTKTAKQRITAGDGEVAHAEHRPMEFAWHPSFSRNGNAPPKVEVVVNAPRRAPQRAPAPQPVSTRRSLDAEPVKRTGSARHALLDGTGSTKADGVIKLMLRPQGATADEIKAVTGWGSGAVYMQRMAKRSGKKLKVWKDRFALV
jgi:hypothetical protein